MRLRQIWCEGNFSHQKANHNLRRVRTQGLGKVAMHCLLSVTSFNLKRMVKLLSRRPPLLTNLIFSVRYTICGVSYFAFLDFVKITILLHFGRRGVFSCLKYAHQMKNFEDSMATSKSGAIKGITINHKIIQYCQRWVTDVAVSSEISNKKSVDTW